jgi:predicted transcriptional regulator
MTESNIYQHLSLSIEKRYGSETVDPLFFPSTIPRIGEIRRIGRGRRPGTVNLPTALEIKRKRESLGLKQADIARLAGVSQSMIARIETGTVDPRISTLRKVIDVLVEAERSKVIARHVMCTPVYSVLSSDPISRAVGIMEERGISQVPVLENGVPVGCISETAIVAAIDRGKLPRETDLLVKEYMESGFPTVPPDADLTTVVHILQDNHAVLVVDRGTICGVITKHDLISLIH